MTAAATLRRWREDPVAFVRECLGATPDPWQVDVLRAFPKNPRVAMTACKGPGKTAVLAWIAWDFLATRPHPKIIATSITADNLSDGLWTEMAKWQKRSPLLSAAFTWTKTSITCNEHPETWFMVARAWPKTGSANEQANTLAGKHADYMLFILDEVGGIPDAVMAAAEAGLTGGQGGGGHEAHIVIAGNPTHLEGPLHRANTSERSLWHMTHITGDPDDPKRSSRVSAEWARQQIAKYGRDNPYVLVNVFGRFPPASVNALLGPDEVRAAMARVYREDAIAGFAKILGVDVARDGAARSVLFPRQGLVALPPKVLRNVDSLQGAAQVAWRTREWGGADAVFVDGTGGFGAGWVDQLKVINHPCTSVLFSGKALDPRYANRRAEMWLLMSQWVKEGGALPNEPELVDELTAVTYTFQGDRLILEPKELVEAKIGRSPDLGDGLALTFAAPVLPRKPATPNRRPNGGSAGYDPLTLPRG